MARLDAVDCGLYRLPLEQELVDARHGVHKAFEVVTLRLRDADGAEGVGYTFTGGRGGAAIRAMAAGDYAELLVGEDGDLIERLWDKLWWAGHYGGRGGASVMALSAIDIALWDLKARRAGLPLWRLLGGHEPAVGCYAGGIDLHLSPQELIAQSEANIARGYRALKMKVGRPRLAEDLAKLAALRGHLGEDFPLMVDANMAWRVDQAVRAAHAFLPYRPLWLEEPIVPDDVEGHARVGALGGVAVATGENLRSLWEFQRLIVDGKIAVPQPDVTNCGGVTAFMKIAHLAEAFHLPVSSHGAHDITVHLMAALPNATWLEAHGFGLDRFIAEPLEIRDGKAIAPERPGHGTDFDWAGLAAHAA